jgi:hypothetical protein
MNPIYDTARHRIDDLHRRAAAERFARSVAPRRARLAGPRESFGALLIRSGERLRSSASIADSLTCAPCDQMVVGRPPLNLR